MKGADGAMANTSIPTARTTNRLAKITLALDIAAGLSFVVTIGLGFAYQPAPGHVSPLTGPAGGAIFLISSLMYLFIVVGTVTGALALRQIKRAAGTEKGKGFAWTGIGTGAMLFGLFLFVIALMLFSQPKH